MTTTKKTNSSRQKNHSKETQKMMSSLEKKIEALIDRKLATVAK